MTRLPGAWLLRLVGLALMLTALAVPLARAPERPVETLVAAWAPPPSDFVEFGEQLLHFRDQGRAVDPTPLVLLHDAGASLHVWEGWVRALTPRHRVITLDVPGSGLSGPAPGGDYRPSVQARRVRELLAHLHVRNAIWVGQGAGADIAWAAAAAQPQTVRGLMLINPGPPAEWPPLWRLARLPGWTSVGPHLLPKAVLQAQWQALLGPGDAPSDRQVERLFELTRRSGNRTALPQLLAQWRQPLPPLPAGLPVWVGWGEADAVTPLTPEVRAAWTARLPQARWAVWPGLGHWPQEEAPLGTVNTLQSWLGDPPAQDGPVARTSPPDQG